MYDPTGFLRQYFLDRWTFRSRRQEKNCTLPADKRNLSAEEIYASALREGYKRGFWDGAVDGMAYYASQPGATQPGD